MLPNHQLTVSIIIFTFSTVFVMYESKKIGINDRS